MRTKINEKVSEEKNTKKITNENIFDYRQIDEMLHSRIRLSIVALLARVETADFNYIKQNVKATDGNISVQCGKLEKVGYITHQKTFVERKSSTSYKITAKGKKALLHYAEKLAKLTLFGDE